MSTDGSVGIVTGICATWRRKDSRQKWEAFSSSKNPDRFLDVCNSELCRYPGRFSRSWSSHCVKVTSRLLVSKLRSSVGISSALLPSSVLSLRAPWQFYVLYVLLTGFACDFNSCSSTGIFISFQLHYYMYELLKFFNTGKFLNC